MVEGEEESGGEGVHLVVRERERRRRRRKCGLLFAACSWRQEEKPLEKRVLLGED